MQAMKYIITLFTLSSETNNVLDNYACIYAVLIFIQKIMKLYMTYKSSNRKQKSHIGKIYLYVKLFSIISWSLIASKKTPISYHFFKNHEQLWGKKKLQRNDSMAFKRISKGNLSLLVFTFLQNSFCRILPIFLSVILRGKTHLHIERNALI